MIYYISRGVSKERHAGGKATNDICSLCEARGWSRLVYPSVHKDNHNWFWRLIRLLVANWFWIVSGIKLKKGDVVIYQHPMKTGIRVSNKHILRLKSKKGIKFIAVIHDLETIRNQKTNSNNEFEDKVLLRQFDVLICHNKNMVEYLIGQGFSADRLVDLGVFDYIIQDGMIPASDDATSLVVAGNLNKDKSGYVYELAPLCSDFDIFVYGIGFDESQAKGIKYQGSYPPEVLPTVMKGKYGVIWDGCSIETCEGECGNYLRYNNPHKLSLYIASGKPVVCWKESAISNFVKQYGIGLAVDSLYDLRDCLKEIDDDSYRKMASNVAELRQRVIHGRFFNDAIDIALDSLNKL